MYLKEIRAKGFKSFADQTVIELDNNLTGIVGPNGSGKSNIVDAIRWVLGEQSVKSLRGDGAMTDVIFSGSKSRKTATSATVTLVFNNEDNYLNTPFTEVIIRRQLFATGESEYSLNGSKCRLKDITDLLIDTGVGKESFNIIGQGAIDSIISTKAEDRRTIFEEAAGVLKYKKRKEKALNQLSKTHQNLERVNDIIKELEIQLEPLRDQAETAKIYLEHKHELTYLEIALTAHDINLLNNDYQTTKEQVKSLTDSLNNIDTSFLTEETELLTKKNKLALLNEQWHKLNSELIVKNGELASLKSEKQLVIERTKYQKQDANLDHALNLKETMHKQQNSLKHLELDFNNLEHDLRNINNELKEIENELNKYNLTYTNNLKELNNLNNLLLSLNQRANHLEQLINEGGNLSSSVKSVLQNKTLTGINNCVAKLIHVEDNYLNVINTCLGATSQFIIVNTENDAKKAINFLRINELGRATFLPLDNTMPRLINESVLSKLVKTDGFVDMALNLVMFDPKYYPVYANLLGSTIVAKDMDSATRISALTDRKYRIVTIDGDLVNVGGSLTGGKYKNNHGLINDTYQLETIKQEILVNESKIKDLNLIISEQKQLIDNSQVIYNNELNKKIRFQELINHKNNSISEQSELIKNTESELKTLTAIVDNNLMKVEDELISKYYQVEADVNVIKNELTNKNIEIEELTSLISEVEHELKSKNSVFNEQQKSLKEAEINLSRYEVKLDYLLNYLNEEYSLTFEKAFESYPLNINPSDARVTVNKLKHQIKKLGDVNTGAIEEYDRVNTRYTFLNSQREDLLNAETNILNIIDDMDSVMKTSFEDTFNSINIAFKDAFKTLFGGGEADLVLTNPSDMLTTGIEIKALPPGKKLMHISLLSGGEKTLTAISLLFAILNTKPVPFCILDEVEAALDEANVVRFCNYIESYNNKTQFLVITHQKRTMEYVHNLYGVTMQEAGVSKLVSVKISD